jgi:UDP-3-O-acyl N-acetylglucosamine deacetylase
VLAERRTQLGEGAAAIHTVEHVLAAVAAHGIDDLVIAMDAPEPPIMDGSAGAFFAALREAGSMAQAGVREEFTIDERVELADGESRYSAEPGDGLTLDVEIEFPHRLIGRQRGEYRLSSESFEQELGGARTFGFVREVDGLRAKGLIRGASTSNAVVLDEHGVVGATLRWPDEFVRHKAMDCVGDLALIGGRLNARVHAVRPSHRGTVLFVRELARVVNRSNASC